MNKKILLVDDEPNVLQGIKRQLRKRYDLTLAVGGAAAIEEYKENGPFAVVVSDMQMPVMNGVQLLGHIRQLNSQTVRVMLTGNADQKTAVDAVNEGSIFRFLSKPCAAEAFSKTLDAALEHYRLITAESELLNNTLSGSIRMLTQVLSLTMPSAFGLTQEARTLSRAIANGMQLRPIWEVEIAAMLMRIGCVSLPPEIIDRYLNDEDLNSVERKAIEDSARLGSDLVSTIPRLEGVAEIIATQYEPPTDPTLPTARVLRVVGDFQRIRTNASPLAALRAMEGRPEYDAAALRHLSEFVQSTFQDAEVSVAELSEGMVLEENVVDLAGRVLIARGNEMHETLIHKLISLHNSGSGVREPIHVRRMVPIDTSSVTSSMAS
ncbi:HD domain-containing phosphohydrolase [Rhodopirellula halodulae]|uniref:HD domain-containing phosphohydrolase n=1 Tax=Rhodopirellula halodulae TaxID=2894198 RepID=UPI001E3026FF|nr:HD domain-containing phosphohydrolase [Rhodopirellula sp. JC737]MCC9658407.1 response regulator [Rhodopirellula sp. JC737]